MHVKVEIGTPDGANGAVIEIEIADDATDADIEQAALADYPLPGFIMQGWRSTEAPE